jgi:signal transduction histidine kinase
MELPQGATPPRTPNQSEIVARTLRHEVGDLLQTIYATVAILQERLSKELTLERRILGDLRGRAEACKHVLDTVHDLVCPLALTPAPVNPSDLAAALVSAAATRHPQLEVRAETTATPAISADQRYLTQVGTRLLTNACQRAQHRVIFRSAPGPGSAEVQWTVIDDGPEVPPDQLSRLLEPFQTTRPGHLGLDLGLANRLVKLHSGRMTAQTSAGGGLAIQAILPVAPPEQG